MTQNDQIPLVDLSIQTAAISDEVHAGFDRVLAAGSFILGPEVEKFETEFAAYCGVDYALGVGNGTDALELAFRAAGIGAGDEIIMPTNTFVATAEAAVRAGADVVLVDCDEDFLIDPSTLAAAITPRTRAVVGVHLYGQTAPMEKLREIVGASSHGADILVVEDAAQAQGASRFGVRAGALGDVAGTSFYPGKNLGAFGDAGGIMTASAEIAERVRELRNHGGTRRYEHIVVGVNSRLDGLQGVVLSAKLDRLDEWNQQRRDAAAYYTELLADVDQVVTPRTVEGNEHVFHLYVVRAPGRDALIAHLGAAGISAAIHYPLPVHLLPAFASLGYARGDFPVAERLAEEILSLPIYPGITREQQQRVVAALVDGLAAAS